MLQIDFKAAERYYRREIMPKVRQGLEELKAENYPLLISKRKPVLEELIAVHQTLIDKLSLIVLDKNRGGYGERKQLNIRVVRKFERKVEAWRYELENIEQYNPNSTTAPGGEKPITDEDIERAKQYPIDNLLEFKRNKGLCLWHDDRNPSMHFYRKDNQVYCFSCSQGGDVIDVYMQLHGENFVEAVKELSLR